jgi:hypothetical protein
LRVCVMCLCLCLPGKASTQINQCCHHLRFCCAAPAFVIETSNNDITTCSHYIHTHAYTHIRTSIITFIQTTGARRLCDDARRALAAAHTFATCRAASRTGTASFAVAISAFVKSEATAAHNAHTLSLTYTHTHNRTITH